MVLPPLLPFRVQAVDDGDLLGEEEEAARWTKGE